MSFHETTVEALTVNPFTLINKGWMLITAGTEQKHQHHDCQLGQTLR